MSIQVSQVKGDAVELIFNPREEDLRVGETLRIQERDSGEGLVVQVVAFRMVTYPSLIQEQLELVIGNAPPLSRELLTYLSEAQETLREAERETEARRLIKEEAVRPFDLACGPLIRTGLIRLSELESIFLLTMHHIISDGWSIVLFFQELSALHRAFANGHDSPLAELSIQYADYAAWQREWLRGEVLERQLSYWKNQLSGELPVIDISPLIRRSHSAI